MTESAPDEEDGLESRLLRAALQRLADQPAEQLSLRQIAQDLGVSHQAPYVHFGSRRRLLAAVAGKGMAEATAQARAVVAADDHPSARLHALADAYLAFIREQPHVHDLANGPTVAKSDHPLLQQAAIEYWDLLHDTIAACQPERNTRSRGPSPSRRGLGDGVRHLPALSLRANPSLSARLGRGTHPRGH